MLAVRYSKTLLDLWSVEKYLRRTEGDLVPFMCIFGVNEHGCGLIDKRYMFDNCASFGLATIQMYDCYAY